MFTSTSFLVLFECLFSYERGEYVYYDWKPVDVNDWSNQWSSYDDAKTQKTENSNLHGFELHRPSNKGTQLMFQVIKAINNQSMQASLELTIQN